MFVSSITCVQSWTGLIFPTQRLNNWSCSDRVLLNFDDSVNDQSESIVNPLHHKLRKPLLIVCYIIGQLDMRRNASIRLLIGKPQPVCAHLCEIIDVVIVLGVEVGVSEVLHL